MLELTNSWIVCMCLLRQVGLEAKRPEFIIVDTLDLRRNGRIALQRDVAEIDDRFESSIRCEVGADQQRSKSHEEPTATAARRDDCIEDTSLALLRYPKEAKPKHPPRCP